MSRKLITAFIERAAADARAGVNEGNWKIYDAARKAKMFEIDNETLELVYNIGASDWREWLPIARPPFDPMWIEWEFAGAADLEEAKRRSIELMGGNAVVSERTGMLVWTQEMRFHHGTSDEVMMPVTCIMMATGSKRECMPMPFLAMLDPVDPDPGSIAKQMHLTEEGQKLCHHSYDTVSAWAFGRAYCERYGMPPVLVTPGIQIDKGNVDWQIAMIKGNETAICCGMAALAMLNVEREYLPIQQSYVSGRAIGAKGNSIPAYVPTVITIRPSAPRRVYEAAREATGIKKRLHDVRGHPRRYKNGRTIWIRAHERGSEEVGPKIAKTYKTAPPVIEIKEQPNGQ